MYVQRDTRNYSIMNLKAKLKKSFLFERAVDVTTREDFISMKNKIRIKQSLVKSKYQSQTVLLKYNWIRELSQS